MSGADKTAIFVEIIVFYKDIAGWIQYSLYVIDSISPGGWGISKQ